MACLCELELGDGHVYLQMASRECAEQFEEQYELYVRIDLAVYGRDANKYPATYNQTIGILYERYFGTTNDRFERAETGWPHLGRL